MRAHVILAEEVVASVDKLVGKRRRSRFIEDAVKEKLERERLGKALKATAGILRDDAYPEWSTSEKVSEWVRISRQEDEERTRRLWKKPGDG